MSRNLVAHYSSGGSDKIYIASIRQNTQGDFQVLGKWGRRGGNIQLLVKGAFKTLTAAENLQLEIFNEKLRKGYTDINMLNYHGPVTMSSVERHLEEDPTLGNKSPSKAPTPQEDEPEVPEKKEKPDPKPKKTPVVKKLGHVFKVVCVNNLGLEHRFEQGAEYNAKVIDDREMILVTDMTGMDSELYAERFYEVK